MPGGQLPGMLIYIDHFQFMAPRQLLLADEPDNLNGAHRIGGGAGDKQLQDVVLVLGFYRCFPVLLVHR
jgi:hypothetical protein